MDFTCSSIKISSNALPAVSTGSKTVPSALSAFSIASEKKNKNYLATIIVEDYDHK